MVLRAVLVILSLLPLLEAQNPEHANSTDLLITNDTLKWLSGKWFYIGLASYNPEFQKEAQKIQADFFHFAPNLTDDTILLQDYQTIEGRCVINSSELRVQRENGTLSKYEGAVEYFGHLKLLKKHGGFMLAFFPEDEKNKGLSLYADKPDIAPELREEFQKAVKSMGIDESEIIYVDWKKDACLQEQKQLDLEKKKTETEKDS